MDPSGSFKVPSMMAQDLAIIMGIVGPSGSPPILQEKRELVRGHKRKGSPNIVPRAADNSETDISSSCTESEDEVEAQIAVSPKTDGAANARTTMSTIASSSSDGESDSDSSGSKPSSATSFHRRKQGSQRMTTSAVHIDGGDEDGPPAAAIYTPTTHELPPTAIPVPSLPDPSTLPQEALELVGEIATVLLDTVTVRGNGLLNATARERRDAVLDEGSLLLLDDRTPLGYVWETFGPTTLPHYLVRIKRRESTQNTHQTSIDAAPETIHDSSLFQSEKNSQTILPSSPFMTPSSYDYPDPTKLSVSRTVYHIPSLSKYVFPGALAGIKGSDASNIHDEEPDEQELDFSDDEAEAMYKRLRRGSFARAPSLTPLSDIFDGEGDDAPSTVDDEANSLYGASPYDSEDVSLSNQINQGTPSSPSDALSPDVSSSLTNFENAAVRNALMLARNSRHRRHGSVSIPQGSVTAGPSQPRENHQLHGRGARGGQKDRRRSERGRGRNSNSQPRGRGHGRGRGAAPERYGQGSSFSFEEYDPHMPRPPSPTSLAIARATGQWADGTPFPYGPAVVSDIPNYGVAPHINPRFAQAFRLPNATPTLPATPQNQYKSPYTGEGSG